MDNLLVDTDDISVSEQRRELLDARVFDLAGALRGNVRVSTFESDFGRTLLGRGNKHAFQCVLLDF